MNMHDVLEDYLGDYYLTATLWIIFGDVAFPAGTSTIEWTMVIGSLLSEYKSNHGQEHL